MVWMLNESLFWDHLAKRPFPTKFSYNWMFSHSFLSVRSTVECVRFKMPRYTLLRIWPTDFIFCLFYFVFVFGSPFYNIYIRSHFFLSSFVLFSSIPIRYFSYSFFLSNDSGWRKGKERNQMKGWEIKSKKNL